MSQLVTLLLDSKLVSVLCHFGNFGCGDGGWTPVKKMDGNKVRHLCTFSLSLPTTGEVSSGGTSALQRQKFHTNDVKLQNFLGGA